MNRLSAILPKILDEPHVSSAIFTADELPTREERWRGYMEVALHTGDEHLICFMLGKIAAEFGIEDMAADTGIDDDYLRRLVFGIDMPSPQMIGAILRTAGVKPVANEG